MNCKLFNKTIKQTLALLLTAAMVATSFSVPVKAEEEGPVVEIITEDVVEDTASEEVAETPEELPEVVVEEDISADETATSDEGIEVITEINDDEAEPEIIEGEVVDADEAFKPNMGESDNANTNVYDYVLCTQETKDGKKKEKAITVSVNKAEASKMAKDLKNTLSYNGILGNEDIYFGYHENAYYSIKRLNKDGVNNGEDDPELLGLYLATEVEGLRYTQPTRNDPIYVLTILSIAGSPVDMEETDANNAASLEKVLSGLAINYSNNEKVDKPYTMKVKVEKQDMNYGKPTGSPQTVKGLDSVDVDLYIAPIVGTIRDKTKSTKIFTVSKNKVNNADSMMDAVINVLKVQGINGTGLDIEVYNGGGWEKLSENLEKTGSTSGNVITIKSVDGEKNADKFKTILNRLNVGDTATVGYEIQAYKNGAKLTSNAGKDYEEGLIKGETTIVIGTNKYAISVDPAGARNGVSITCDGTNKAGDDMLTQLYKQIMDYATASKDSVRVTPCVETYDAKTKTYPLGDAQNIWISSDLTTSYNKAKRRWNEHEYKAQLIEVNGTPIDTNDDITASANRLLGNLNINSTYPVVFEIIRGTVNSSNSWSVDNAADGFNGYLTVNVTIKMSDTAESTAYAIKGYYDDSDDPVHVLGSDSGQDRFTKIMTFIRNHLTLYKTDKNGREYPTDDVIYDGIDTIETGKYNYSNSIFVTLSSVSENTFTASADMLSNLYSIDTASGNIAVKFKAGTASSNGTMDDPHPWYGSLTVSVNGVLNTKPNQIVLDKEKEDNLSDIVVTADTASEIIEAIAANLAGQIKNTDLWIYTDDNGGMRNAASGSVLGASLEDTDSIKKGTTYYLINVDPNTTNDFVEVNDIKSKRVDVSFTITQHNIETNGVWPSAKDDSESKAYKVSVVIMPQNGVIKKATFKSYQFAIGQKEKNEDMIAEIDEFVKDNLVVTAYKDGVVETVDSSYIIKGEMPRPGDEGYEELEEKQWYYVWNYENIAGQGVTDFSKLPTLGVVSNANLVVEVHPWYVDEGPVIRRGSDNATEKASIKEVVNPYNGYGYDEVGDWAPKATKNDQGLTIFKGAKLTTNTNIVKNVYGNLNLPKITIGVAEGSALSDLQNKFGAKVKLFSAVKTAQEEYRDKNGITKMRPVLVPVYGETVESGWVKEEDKELEENSYFAHLNTSAEFTNTEGSLKANKYSDVVVGTDLYIGTATKTLEGSKLTIDYNVEGFDSAQSFNISVVKSDQLYEAVLSNKAAYWLVYGANGKDVVKAQLLKDLEGNISAKEMGAKTEMVIEASKIITKEAYDKLKQEDGTYPEGIYYYWELKDFNAGDKQGEFGYTVQVTKLEWKKGETSPINGGSDKAYGRVTINPKDGTIIKDESPWGNLYKTSSAELLQQVRDFVKNYKVSAYDNGQPLRHDMVEAVEGDTNVTDKITYVYEIKKIAGKTIKGREDADIIKDLDAIKAYNGKDAVESKNQLSLVFTVTSKIKADGVVKTINTADFTVVSTVLEIDAYRVDLVVYADASMTEAGKMYMKRVYVKAGKVVGNNFKDKTIEAYADNTWYHKGKVWNLNTSPVNEDMRADWYWNYDIGDEEFSHANEIYTFVTDAAIDCGLSADYTYDASGVESKVYNGKAYAPKPKNVTKTDKDGKVTKLTSKKISYKYAVYEGETVGKIVKKPKNAGRYAVLVYDKSVSKKKPALILPYNIEKINLARLDGEFEDYIYDNRLIANKAVALKKNGATVKLPTTLKINGVKFKAGKDFTFINDVDVAYGKTATFKDSGIYQVNIKAASDSVNLMNDRLAFCYDVQEAGKLVANAKIKPDSKVKYEKGNSLRVGFTMTMKDGTVFKYDAVNGIMTNKKTGEIVEGFGVNYPNSNKPGTATIYVFAYDAINNGGYLGTITGKYTITGGKKLTKSLYVDTDLKLASRSKSGSIIYNGSEWTLQDILKLDVDEKGAAVHDDTEVIEILNGAVKGAEYGIDYTIEYSKNILPGKAKVTFKAKDGSGWTGKFSKTFTIKSVNLKSAKNLYNATEGTGRLEYAETTNNKLYFGDPAEGGSWTVKSKKYVLTDDALESLVTDMKYVDARTNWSGDPEQHSLVAGTDFTVTYKNNGVKSKKDIKITIKGKGGYSGKKTFTISRQSLY